LRRVAGRQQGENNSEGIAFLECKPELIHDVDCNGDTALHSVLHKSMQNKDLIMNAWKNPEALRAVNLNGETPFHFAIRYDGPAAELQRTILTVDELVSAYTHENKLERLMPVLEAECELLHDLLLPDVAGVVFEYLGFDFSSNRSKKRKLGTRNTQETETEQRQKKEIRGEATAE